MKVIGQLVEHRANTVNPDDRKTIRQMLSTWSQDVVDNASAAYRCYKDLKGNVNNEFQKLADTATPTQLMLIGRGEGTGLAYDAAMALRRNGKVPPRQQLRGHLGGFMDSKFNQTTVQIRSYQKHDSLHNHHLSRHQLMSLLKCQRRKGCVRHR